MSGQFGTIAIAARRRSDNIVDSVLMVESALQELGARVVVEDVTAERLPPGSRDTVRRGELGRGVDLVVVVGGDGSLLGIARDVAASAVPVVGVNRGGLGFLAAIAPHEIKEKLTEIMRGDYTLEEHFLLRAQVLRSGERVRESTALNDVVVNPASMARMMEFELWVDDEFVYDQRSDGLIVASPTGSTAYALSAGGPIMHPGLDAVVIVPMFPHTLTSRPLVIKGDATVKIRIRDVADTQPQMSCDSQVNVPLEVGDEVIVRKFSTPLKLLYPSGHSFYEACRSKLDWASRLGGQTRTS
jgi:NAD+ kinase